MIINTKKGQVLENLGGLAVGLAVLMMTLVVAFLVLDQGKDEIIDNAAQRSSVFNTTNATHTQTLNAFTMIDPECVSERAVNVIAVYNQSEFATAVRVSDQNYTVSFNLINISSDGLANSTSSDFATNMGTTFRIQYDCAVKDAGYNGTSTLQNATQDVTGWAPLVVVVVIGAAIFGLVALFRRRE